MSIDISSIKNPEVQVFYKHRWPMHRVNYDFTCLLAEEHLDFRMVDTSGRKSDTPRESIAHLLYVELVYLNGAKSGRLEFKSMGVEHYSKMTKSQLLAEWERIDQEVFSYLTAEEFDSKSMIEVPWGGKMNVIDLLFFLRDHDILHTGWNLAVMDHLNIPRFESLINYWGP
jgi:uncharacterized damage-inducible protein DinB